MFIFTINGLYSRLGKLLESSHYQECPSLAFTYFLETHKNFLVKKNLSPWELVFYSRLYLVTNPFYFEKVVVDTYKFILKHNLNFSLNDTHEVHGIKQPLMESFFHWGGHFQITPSFIKTLVDCGLKLDSNFYNEVLSLTQGLEVSESFQVTNTPRKWNFIKCYEVFHEYLGASLNLNEDNLKYLQELSVQKA